MPTEWRHIIEIRHDVEFLEEMLESGGVAGWNAWVRSISSSLTWNPLSPGWLEGEAEPPIQVDLNFSGADLSNRRLDGIDLSFAWLEGAVFDGSSLRGARLVSVPHAMFRSADLTSADMQWAEITAADFSQAKIDGLDLDRAMFHDGKPPAGLPAKIVERIRRRDPMRDRVDGGDGLP